MNSGDLLFRLMKYSNEEFKAFWNDLSLLNALLIILSYLSFSSKRCCTKSTGSFNLSGSLTNCFPVSLRWEVITSLTVDSPSGTRRNKLYILLESSYLSSTSIFTRPEFSMWTSLCMWLAIISPSTTLVIFTSLFTSK
ncbi:unnamed protein product [Musa hybrid cultivar]